MPKTVRQEIEELKARVLALELASRPRLKEPGPLASAEAERQWRDSIRKAQRTRS